MILTDTMFTESKVPRHSKHSRRIQSNEVNRHFCYISNQVPRNYMIGYYYYAILKTTKCRGTFKC